MDKKKLSQALWGLWIIIWIWIAFLIKLDNILIICWICVALWVPLSRIPFMMGKKEQEKQDSQEVKTIEKTE